MEMAISYKRFSSRKQARGDTERRQADLAEAYCKRHHLRLIETYLDAGVSGFTGENLSDDSALKALLNAAKDGKFPPGTRLIVEALDRLSRQQITTAVRLFLDILDTGLVLVTLIDGEQVFTKERVDADLTALIIAVVYLSRANNEARAKRERALYAQQTARTRAREHKIPMTAECPSWLTLKRKGRGRKFVVDKERTQVIERIFTLSASGMGQHQIVHLLNSHAVPTFSGRPKWRPGMIGHLLSNQAVIGVFHPCLSMTVEGKRRRVPDPEGPIPGYYPAVISDELFERGRLATRGRMTRGAHRTMPAYKNLVPRIGRCAICGAPLHHYENFGGWSYLRCANGRYQECSNRLGFPYGALEAVLLSFDTLMALVDRIIGCQGGERFEGDNPGREGSLARLRLAKTGARSSDAAERHLSRRALVVELRDFLEVVVLHPNRTITVHIKPDPQGRRVVCLISRDGLQGIQVKSVSGETGFIERSAVCGFISPTETSLATAKPDMAIDPALEHQRLEEAMQRVRILKMPGGDWQAVAVDPMQMVAIVAQAERSAHL